MALRLISFTVFNEIQLCSYMLLGQSPGDAFFIKGLNDQIGSLLSCEQDGYGKVVFKKKNCGKLQIKNNTGMHKRLNKNSWNSLQP